MSEASVFNSEVPQGWYADPAKPDMQRWWTGAEWTDHVRYTDKPQPLLSVTRETAPVVVEMPAPEASVSLRPVEAPSYQPLDRPAVIGRTPVAPRGFPESTFDRFYTPMRRFEPHANSGAPAPVQGSTRALWLWIGVIAVVGVGVGIAAWVLLR